RLHVSLIQRYQAYRRHRVTRLAPGAGWRPSRANHDDAPSSWSAPLRCSIVVVAGAARRGPADTGSTTGTTRPAPQHLPQRSHTHVTSSWLGTAILGHEAHSSRSGSRAAPSRGP